MMKRTGTTPEGDELLAYSTFRMVAEEAQQLTIYVKADATRAHKAKAVLALRSYSRGIGRPVTPERAADIQWARITG